MRRWLLAGTLGVLTAALLAPSAGAASKAAHGWWWRAETGLLGAAVPPPGVPEDGLVVETTPDGPSAVSALRYRLADGETQPVLVLTVAEEHGEPTIQACAATDTWRSTHGGPWGDRPTYDCGGAVDGVPSGDGEMWQWDVDSLVRRRRLDVVLVPAPGVGRVTFQPPDDSSLQTRRRGAAGQDFAAPPVSDFSDPTAAPRASNADSPASVGQDAGGSAGPAFSPEDGAGPQSAPPPAVAPGQSSEAPAPLVAESGPTGAVAAPAAPMPAAGDDTSRTVGAIVAALALVLGVTLWRRDVGAMPLGGALGGTRAVAGQQIRGLGRFTKPRVGSPRPLR